MLFWQNVVGCVILLVLALLPAAWGVWYLSRLGRLQDDVVLALTDLGSPSTAQEVCDMARSTGCPMRLPTAVRLLSGQLQSRGFVMVTWGSTESWANVSALLNTMPTAETYDVVATRVHALRQTQYRLTERGVERATVAEPRRRRSAPVLDTEIAARDARLETLSNQLLVLSMLMFIALGAAEFVLIPRALQSHRYVEFTYEVLVAVQCGYVSWAFWKIPRLGEASDRDSKSESSGPTSESKRGPIL